MKVEPISPLYHIPPKLPAHQGSGYALIRYGEKTIPPEEVKLIFPIYV